MGPLQKNKLFRLVGISGFLIALIFFGLSLYAVEMMCCDFSSAGVGRFLTALQTAGKLPFQIFSGTLALLGLIALIHRSNETQQQINYTALQIDNSREQIELTRQRNDISEFLDLQSAFIEMIDSVVSENDLVKVVDKYKLFKELNNIALGEFDDCEPYSSALEDLKSASEGFNNLRLKERSGDFFYEYHDLMCRYIWVFMRFNIELRVGHENVGRKPTKPESLSMMVTQLRLSKTVAGEFRHEDYMLFGQYVRNSLSILIYMLDFFEGDFFEVSNLERKRFYDAAYPPK